MNSPKSLLLGDLANRLGATVKGDSDIVIDGIGPLELAGPNQLSFVIDKRYLPLASQSRAAALLVHPSLQDLNHTLLISERPYLALARAAQLFAAPPILPEGVHVSAYVAESVQMGAGVSVGPLSQIGSGCRIGSGTKVYGGVYLGSGVEMGEDCLIYPGVTILDGCKIGNRVIIHSGTVVGSDGFGFAQDELGQHVKIPQVGMVQIDDDVEIGSNCSIDRATFGRTWIRCGAKIDNLVQIAHNVVVGEHSILVSQVGISGSTNIGKHVTLAGQVGIAGHLKIGDRVRVGAKSGVGSTVKAGEDISGIPAIPHKEWLKMVITMRQLPRLRDELRQLKKKIQELEKTSQED